ncbi:MAG TPA: hypothetical protein PKH39_03110 [Woeseiaceae bacterium]|nr:hypothetical protein [Woeseiaceae bacterium]
MNKTPESDLPAPSRWTLIRDLGVFQIKLLVDGLRDLVLVPISLVAGVASVLSGKDGNPGPQFYHALSWGKQTEHWIDLFGALKNSPEQKDIPTPFTEQGMDSIVERFEDFVVSEYKRGGVTAQAKEQLDKLLRNIRRNSQE